MGGNSLSPRNVCSRTEPRCRTSSLSFPLRPWLPWPSGYACSINLPRSLSLETPVRGFHSSHPPGRASNLCPTSLLPQDTCYTLDWHFHVATCQQAYWKAEPLICNCLRHPWGIPTERSPSSIRWEERRERKGMHQGREERREG